MLCNCVRWQNVKSYQLQKINEAMSEMKLLIQNLKDLL